MAVLGAFNYTYSEATRSQSLPDWIGSHARTFRFLDGVPELVMPHGLRPRVNKDHRYEPDTNPSYQDMTAHYLDFPRSRGHFWPMIEHRRK